MVIFNPTENAEGPWLIEYCNRSFCEMHGFDRSELIGKDIRMVSSDEIATEVELPNEEHEKIKREFINGKTLRRATYQRLKQGSIRIEEIHKRKDGSTFHIQASSCLVTWGGQERVLGIDQDITEHMRTKKALAWEGHLFKALLDNIPDFIYFKDLQSRFFRTTSALARAFGMSDPADFVGKTDFDFFTHEHAQAAFEDEQKIIQTGRPMVGVLEKETWPDHPDTWASTTKLPLRDEKGNIVGTFGISRDFTKTKQMEEVLARQTEELRLRNKELDERNEEIERLNVNLNRLVDHDGLTGVYNRRFFDEYFEIEVRRVKNFVEHKAQLVLGQDNDMNFGLAMIDIDHFKYINDTCGHLVGDDVLKQVIEIVERNIFSRDVLCRYGGDEFALLLTKTSNRGILQAAEKIRKEIDEHAFVFGENQECQHVTISVGLAAFGEILDKGSEGILKLADDRLLRAKNSGRNCIVYADRF
jgi:diguanylate cyclase (GGDEF)-like protein/PAS domain S-box-containing protein